MLNLHVPKKMVYRTKNYPLKPAKLCHKVDKI